MNNEALQNNTVLLAFSGGLDTSYCARYLSVDRGMTVHSVIVNTGGFTADELQRIEARARACGVASHTTIDRTQELYDHVLRYLIAGNVLKNATYPLSVSAERVMQAIAIAEHAIATGVSHIAHGSTGAGNDQVRFDVIFRILCPSVTVLTPIRDQQLSREDEIAYLTTHGVEGDWTKAAYSVNQGIWGTTIGGRETLTSDLPLPAEAWSPAPKLGLGLRETLAITFDGGQPVGVDGVAMNPVDAIRAIEERGRAFGIGRDMHVGDTIIGIKGRVAFEAAAAVMIIKAHHALEKHALTKWQLNLKDQQALWYGQLLHEGLFLEPAMRSMEAFFRHTQEHVRGVVTLELADERFRVCGVSSDADLMRSGFASYGEMNRAWSGNDVKGYSTIAAIPSTLYASVHGDPEWHRS